MATSNEKSGQEVKINVDISHTRPSPRILTLEKDDVPSFQMILDARQSSDNGRSSLKVDAGWITKHLESYEHAKLSKNIITDEDKTSGAGLKSANAPSTKPSTGKDASKQLIEEVMNKIKEELKPPDGSEVKPSNSKLGVGPELSKLLDEMEGADNGTQGPGLMFERKQSSGRDSTIRNEGNDAGEDGAPNPGRTRL